MACVLVGGCVASAPAQPAGTLTRGVSLGLFASAPDFDYGPMIDEAAARGARDLLIVVPWAQPDVRSVDLRSFPVQAVRRAVARANRAGLAVAVMPIIRLDDRRDGAWRGRIDARPGPWFSAYEVALVELAQAVNGQATRLVVGSELVTMGRHETHWRATIARVRGVFGGELTYSANWDAYTRIPFWDALDLVGVTAYFPIDAQSAATMRASWTAPLMAARRFARQIDRPLVFTEVGYPNHRAAAQRPWDLYADPIAAPALQARLLGAACAAITPENGLYIWNWFGRGGPRRVEYSPRGKPAARVAQACFERRDV